MRYFSPVFLTTFFFVSGYLFKENCSFLKVFEQRTRTLLLPFLLLGMIMIILSQILTFNEKVPFVDELKGLIFQNGTNQLLWFIAALYVYSLIFYWIERFSQGTKGLLLISVLLFVLNWLYTFLKFPALPWHITSFGFACFYMGVGKLYRKQEERINQWIGRRYVIVSLLILYIVLITLFDLRISFAGGKYMIDALSLTLPGLAIMIYVSKHIFDNSRFLLFVGANTLFYFAFHGKVYSLLQTICHKVIPTDISSISEVEDAIAIIIVLLDALILILPARFVNRYCPFLLGKGFKLWKS